MTVRSALSERERGVMRLLRQHGPLTRARLMKLTGLAGPAVFRATEHLSELGLVSFGEPQIAGRGQPSHLISIEPEAVYVLGVSILTDSAELALMDLNGEIRVVDELIATVITRAQVFEAIDRFLSAASVKLGPVAKRLAAIGLTVPGFFVGEGEKLNPAAELDDWALTELAPEFEARYGAPTYVENNANAAAVGEHLLGTGKDLSNFAYVSIASGFGGGVILDNKLWRGSNGNAGEFAALLKTAGVEPPSLETLRTSLAEHGVATSNVLDLVTRFNPTWPGIDAWLDRAAPAIRSLALLVQYSLDVDALIIGGRIPVGLAKRLAAMAQIRYEERAKRIRRDRPHPIMRILPAKIGERAYLSGAAAMPLADLYFDPVGVSSG